MFIGAFAPARVLTRRGRIGSPGSSPSRRRARACFPGAWRGCNTRRPRGRCVVARRAGGPRPCRRRRRRVVDGAGRVVDGAGRRGDHWVRRPPSSRCGHGRRWGRSAGAGLVAVAVWSTFRGRAAVTLAWRGRPRSRGDRLRSRQPRQVRALFPYRFAIRRSRPSIPIARHARGQSRHPLRNEVRSDDGVRLSSPDGVRVRRVPLRRLPPDRSSLRHVILDKFDLSSSITASLTLLVVLTAVGRRRRGGPHPRWGHTGSSSPPPPSAPWL